MIGRSPAPSCAKCGHAVPPGAGFCPNCGTQVHELSFTQPQSPESDTTALQPPPPTSATAAVTVGPTGVATSLDSPARPAVRHGDGPFQPGQQISARYTILKLLGAGGMGAVYQAFDHELGVAVAIKVIRPAAQADATAAKELELRFKRELVLARQVTHKHVVRIHDLGEIDGIKYLTMPFIEGETLAAVMRQTGPLPLDRVLKIAQQVAQGLGAAHDKGVVHRDLKPENIMLERQADEPVPLNGDALIMDFGIARSVEAGATQTAAGSVIGTLEYMAPEQAQGRKVDQRADQYAFGLIVYDMLVGRQRLASGEGAMAELLNRIAAPPAELKTLKPNLPQPVNDVVMRCLQPNPDARFPTTAEMVHAFDHLTPDGRIRSDTHEVIVPGRTRPAWQLAAAAALIVALAGAAGWLASDQLTEPPLPPASREPVSVLIADFENHTGDPIFGGVIEQAIGLGIEGAKFINAFPRRDALRAAAAIKPGATLDEATAKLVALREGISTVLVGDISPRGSGYQIRIRGVGPGADGTVRYSLEGSAAAKADVLAAVGDLAGRVRTALGDTDTPAPGDAFTAASLEAASVFATAQEMQALGRRDEAIRKYIEAISLDKDFGRAYSGLAAQYAAQGRTAEADANYREALARLDRMTERERLRTRGAYYLFARNNTQAVQELTQLLETYPFDSVGLGNLALAHFYLRDFTQALDIGRRAASVQPNNVLRRYNVALYALYGGQYEAAIAESDAARQLNPSAEKAYVARALAEAALGRTPDAVKTYEALAKLSPDGASFAASGVADIAALEGRHADAIALLDQGIAADEAQKSTARAAGKRVMRGEMHLVRGDSAAAARDAQAAAAATIDNNVRSAAGLLLARAGRVADAQKLADSLEARLEGDYQAYGKLVRAEIALAQGQGRAALDLARQAEKLADTWLGRLIMARAYLMLDAFPEADSQLDVVTRRQGEATAIFLDDVPSYRYVPQIHYYRGRAQEGLKSAGAAASYKTFLEFSKTGEGALAADARARLAKLGS